MEKEMGETYHYIRQNLQKLKYQMNELKIEFGIQLLAAKKFMEDNPQDDETFDTLLAEIHLNKRRVKQMMDNARYMIDNTTISSDDYKFYDSSIVNLARLHNEDPEKYIYLSYSDAVKEIKEEEGD